MTHLRSTIEHADRIVVIDESGIVGAGTHEELLALGGIYRSLHGAQFDELADFDAIPT